jgi:hypothetical protein
LYNYRQLTVYRRKFRVVNRRMSNLGGGNTNYQDTNIKLKLKSQKSKTPFDKLRMSG